MNVKEPPVLPDSLIFGGAGMGTAMRKTDWSKTSLGPLHGWPQSLRTSVSLCLNSPFPAIVSWGQDIIVVYNDAYCEIMPCARSVSLGRKGHEVLPEIWHIMEPQLAKVLQSAAPSGTENELILVERNGYVEENYFTYSYSPIYNESGKIAGVFTVLTDTTQAVIGERHLYFLRDLAKNLSTAKTIETIFKKAIEVLNKNRKDFPFTMLYQVDEGAGKAKLAGTTGLTLPHPSVPGLIDFSKNMIGSRNIYKCVTTGQSIITNDLRDRLGDMPTGAWDLPPEQSFIVPIKKAGTMFPYAVMVIGINPHHRLDEAYQSFFELVVEQIATEISYVLSFEEQVDIRKKTEDRQRQIYNLITQAPVGMAVLSGPDFIVEVANDKALQFWDRRVAGLVLGKPLFTIIPETNARGLKQILQRVYQTGEGFFTPEYPAKITRRGKDENIYVGFAAEPLREMDGTIIGVMMVANEVTELVRSRKKIEESEERLKMAIHLTQVGTWEYHPLTGELNWSEQCRNIYAAPADQPLDISMFEKHIHPDDRGFVMEAIAKAMDPDGDTSYNLMYRILRFNDNSERWIRTSGRVYFNADKQAELFIGTVLDITDEKYRAERLEMKVAERTRELRRGRDFIEVILDASLVLITVFDVDTRILSFNKKCETVFGISKKDAIGKTFAEVFPGIEQSETFANLKRALSGEYVHNSSYQSTVNGRFYESFFVPLSNAEQQLYAVLMTAHDITENIESTQKLKKLNNELLRSNLDLEQFAYIASHDLQEPLRKIQVFTELLQSNLHDVDTAQMHLHKISKSASTMSKLIKAVLNYSRLSKTEDSFVRLSLQEIADAVIADFELRIAEKNAQVVCHGLPVVKCFPLQITQLFSNLLSNALKFSGVHPIITITSRNLPAAERASIPLLNAGEDYVEISFKDNGIGFEQKYIDRIFTIFQRLNEKSAYEGTGIGLALCKKIVENHMGYITAVGEVGKGSTFYIYLPA